MFVNAFFLLLPALALAQSNSTLIPPPPNGLSGESNYWLQSNGDLLHQVQALISITDDFHYNETGVTFLLQVFGPLLNNPALVNYQAIGISADGSNDQLGCLADGFNSYLNFTSIKSDSLANLTGNTIPGGTNMSITLNTSSTGQLASVDFEILMGGKTLKDTITLDSNSTSSIAAVEFNIIGLTGTGGFTSGAGSVLISAADPIIAVNSLPNFIGNIVTGGTGNSRYSQLFPGNGKDGVAQNFNIS
jgi:hypothetical protein